MRQPLNSTWIHRIHKAAIDASLAEKRDALLSLLDKSLVAALPDQHDALSQLLTDLDSLNRFALPGEPPENAPIVIWLKNAITLSEGQEACPTFQAALNLALEHARHPERPSSVPPEPPREEAPPPPPPPEDRDGKTTPWPLYLIIILLMGMVGTGGYLWWQSASKPPPVQVQPSGPDAAHPVDSGLKPTAPPELSAKPDVTAKPGLTMTPLEPSLVFCMEPPAPVLGKADVGFGFRLTDPEAKKVIAEMKGWLVASPKHGPAWSKRITRSLSPLSKDRWDVYFKDVDSADAICTWLSKCKKLDTCKERKGLVIAPTRELDRTLVPTIPSALKVNP